MKITFMMSKLFFRFAVFAMVAGCATIPQNSNLNDLLLMNTKTNSNDRVMVVFDTQLPLDHKVSMGSLQAASNINIIYEKMIKQYMQSKFSNQGEGGFQVKVTLKSLATNTKMDSSMSNVLGLNGSTQTSLEAELAASISIKKGNKEIGTKEIISKAEKANEVSNQ